MRILVTGVTGFVGCRLVQQLAAAEHTVGGTFIGPEPDLTGVALYEADLLDSGSLAGSLEAFAPDAVIHLAALSHVGESWLRMAEYFRVNVLGTENLLRAAGDRRVVIASSAEVYGSVPEREQPIVEERTVSPRTPYALTKAAAERLALEKGAVVVRCFNIVGPGQSENFALPSFASRLRAIARGEDQPVLRVGNLTPRRDFVHVDDACEAYRLLVENSEAGSVYNVATGRAVSIEEALRRLVALSGLEVRILTDPERVRPVDLPLLQGDASRLRALGWSPKRGLDDALAALWRSVAQPAAVGHQPSARDQGDRD